MFPAVTGIVSGMPYNEEQRTKIASAVRRARVAKGLNKEAAARAAKISSITWKRVEDAEGVRDATLGKILSLLGLPDVDTILHGGPIEVAPAAPASAHWLDTLSTQDIIEQIRVLFAEVRRRVPSGPARDKPEDWPEPFFEGVGDEPPPVRRREDSNDGN